VAPGRIEIMNDAKRGRAAARAGTGGDLGVFSTTYRPGI
jgi:hypothetical protein